MCIKFAALGFTARVILKIVLLRYTMAVGGTIILFSGCAAFHGTGSSDTTSELISGLPRDTFPESNIVTKVKSTQEHLCMLILYDFKDLPALN